MAAYTIELDADGMVSTDEESIFDDLSFATLAAQRTLIEMLVEPASRNVNPGFVSARVLDEGGTEMLFIELGVRSFTR